MGVRVLAVTMATALVLCGSAVFGQCCGGGAAYVPAAPVYASYYAPAAPAYATYYAPSTAYYAPAPVPYAAYYAPPVAYTAYYAPPVAYSTYYAPPVAYSTYYAPRVAYAPAVVAYPYARPGWSMYGTPRVYVAGEPVRNILRATTP